MLTAVLVVAFLLCLPGLVAAIAMQDRGPETPYPGRHDAALQIGDTPWTS